MIYSVVHMRACSVMVNCLQPYSLQPVRLLCLRDFSRQEYWSGLPFPPPWDIPDPEIKPSSPASLALAGIFFTTEPSEKPHLKKLLRLIEVVKGAS